MYLSNRRVMGYLSKDNPFKVNFIVMVGGRGIGKTFSTMNYCLRRFFKKNEKFLWLRLTERSADKLLALNGKDLIDSKLLIKWGIESVETKGNTVKINDREAGRVMALSTFYNDKGVALNKSGDVKIVKKKTDDKTAQRRFKDTVKKYKVIVLDEMNREKNEKNTFEIGYALVNQLENICRLDSDRLVIMLGNTLDEASDILVSCFNFIPNERGMHILRKKHAIIWYIEDDKQYMEKRAESLAGILMPEESTFTNTLKSDVDLLYTGKTLPKPIRIIRFSNTCYFTWHEGSIISKMKQPPKTGLPTITMAPYLIGYPFYKDQMMNVVQLTQGRIFRFDQMLTLKLFYKEIKQLKMYN